MILIILIRINISSHMNKTLQNLILKGRVKMYAQNLKKIREKLGLSVAKLAKQLEMPASTLTNYEYEKREPSYTLFVQMSKNLNINLNWFVSGKGEMFNAPEFEQVEDELTLKVEAILKKNGLIK